MLTPRAAVAAYQLAVIQLIEACGLAEIPLSDLSINLDGRRCRVDIARLTEDGRHIGEWLQGYSIDPFDLDTFGTPVGLPTAHGPTH
jgi:hypothetical protein